MIVGYATRTPAAPTHTLRDAQATVRELDLPKLKAMIRDGWDVNMPFDDEGNTALGRRAA